MDSKAVSIALFVAFLLLFVGQFGVAYVSYADGISKKAIELWADIIPICNVCGAGLGAIAYFAKIF